MRRYFLFLFFIPALSYAQPNPSDAAFIKVKLKKLNTLASVLYVAAHPDDENTRVITSLGNDRLATAAYLSMTRGDGGQNLIGSEMRDELGLIRTQELLAARRIDGGEQFFTRAVDFGFSKSATETFSIWGKDEILSDVVKVFRQYQPDVIITRFPPDERAGHGHHTASAILAQEAFDAAARADVFPDQTKEFGTWQVKRLYTNTGRWWNNTINENTPGIVSLNVGGYSKLLGQSYSEIAAVSRSQHKSQGFGSAGLRGDQLEFLEHVKGDKAEKDIFEGVNTTWSRVKGGERVQLLVDKAIATFDIEKPEALVPQLLKIRKEIMSLAPSVWRTRKLKEAEQLIQDCMGLYLEAKADHYWTAPGQPVTLNFEITNRSTAETSLVGLHSSELAWDTTMNQVMKNNIPLQLKTTKVVPASMTYSDPYWLKHAHEIGRFAVTDATLIGKAQNDPAMNFDFAIQVGGETISFSKPVHFKWTDPAKGELMRPYEIVPAVFVNLEKSVMVFNDDQPREVKVKVKSATRGSFKGDLRLKTPAGWKTVPESIAVTMTQFDEEQTKSFMVYPTAQELTGALEANLTVEGDGTFNRGYKTIQYDHIRSQILLPPASLKVVRINLKREGNLIGYIKGAGDEIPTCLRNMGYEVWEMKEEEVTADNLKRVDAVVVGVRAVNTNERIGFFMNTLLDYVKGGGTLVMQYNTNFDLEAEVFSPYPLTISRDRVTEENSEVRILKPEHPVLNTPNKIASTDFDGWIQERGLYYPNKWDANYEAILSMNDKGEQARDGSLLVAKYGEGYYVYTGLSFFRELPEGVAGAYKLFANLVSLHAPKTIATNPSNGKKKKGRN